MLRIEELTQLATTEQTINETKYATSAGINGERMERRNKEIVDQKS